jgi:hypothetical protein
MSLRVTPLGPATLMCCELVGESRWCSVDVIGLGVAMVTAYITGLAVYLCVVACARLPHGRPLARHTSRSLVGREGGGGRKKVCSN